jgi:probable rRNA maturation factor
MILLDPDLDPDPASRTSVVAHRSVRPQSAIPWPVRIPTKQTLNRFLTEAQAAVRLKGQVTVLLTTDAAIRRLNRQFRGKNKATDVLSFPAEGIGAEQIAGDLAVSVDTARRQAAEQGHALTCELKVLILHGLLHLAGYDHEIDDGKMARREQLLRARLRLPLGLIERATAPNKDFALKGHGFSRAETSPERSEALAAGRIQSAEKSVPKGLKPKGLSAAPTARLKSCPVTKHGSSAAKAKRPGAPSIPRPHAEWVGSHNPKPAAPKPSPRRTAKRSPRP